ncbi:maleylpyruvate isomerase family mycothiol-dependent enzyme [Sphaerisporangium sp. NBC_01403]|uniref:maleylpyruvate isomerase family mycothiol-dependent enzyme n=1 Tax=Sphaerisporangium sp. NBC_01403 TaxID=2903599 RepID=UPI003253711B
MTSESDLLQDLDPFDIFDAEAERLDRFFSSLGEEGWNGPTRCAGWSVRDVLAHLAGEELYNHACLTGDIEGFFRMLEREGIPVDDAYGWVDRFNDWCVRRRRGLPVEQVLREWREKNGETRRRMRELGRDTLIRTAAGPYPAGLQTFHYDSEYATHADDVGAPVSAEEAGFRLEWRVRFGLVALAERKSNAQVERDGDRIRGRVDGLTVELSAADFVEATVGRLPEGHPLDPRVRSALRCLA